MHIKTIYSNTNDCSEHTGCGECQASCQSACKTSCTVGNQTCKQKDEKINRPVLKPNAIE